jgi:tetratricopeptide (TPR) repeat protein
LLDFKIGANYFDCEEFYEAEKLLTEAFDRLNKIPDSFRNQYVNLMQDLYNHLGITHCNRGKNETGLPFLEKATEVYEKASKDSGTSTDSIEGLKEVDERIKSQIQTENASRLLYGRDPLLISGTF